MKQRYMCKMKQRWKVPNETKLIFTKWNKDGRYETKVRCTKWNTVRCMKQNSQQLLTFVFQFFLFVRVRLRESTWRGYPPYRTNTIMFHNWIQSPNWLIYGSPIIIIVSLPASWQPWLAFHTRHTNVYMISGPCTYFVSILIQYGWLANILNTYKKALPESFSQLCLVSEKREFCFS